MTDINPIRAAGIGQDGFGRGPGSTRGIQPREIESIKLPEIEEPGGELVGDADTGLSFSELLSDGVSAVSEKQLAAQDTIANFAAGKGAGVHDVMMAMGKSEVAFAMMLEVRNRLVDAWREISRIQV